MQTIACINLELFVTFPSIISELVYIFGICPPGNSLIMFQNIVIRLLILIDLFGRLRAICIEGAPVD